MAKRKWLPLIMAAVLMILGGTGIVQAYTISYDISDDYIMAGESFDVDISISDIFSDPLLSSEMFLGFDLSFESSFSLMSFDGYSLSGIYMDLSPNPSPLPGMEFVSGAYLPPPIFADNYHLATLHFTAGDILGVETINFSGLGHFGDMNNPFGGEDISLTSSVNVAVVPEPGTIILMVSGLLGLGLFHRRRKGTKK